ncbi:uncharacterized protein KIAA1614 [Patella vulgata]|uniref:uncharacterized protein KIAA1614 n=1 Tax=Patella vulgata TaxID=6465 RepID=UPI00217F6BBC|nr:uncharacterized protein KIAA1614 [Patella vulgata]
MESQSASCDPNDDSNLSAATGGSENKEDLYAKVGNFRKKGAGVEVVSMTRSSSDEADLTLFSDDEHGGPPLPARRYKQDSTLKSSKGFSSSKSSLLNKMGAIKNSTKSKIKSFRKAVSLERGLDNVETIETPSKAEKLEKSKSKMRKAPSLKSLTALFGKKSKSKKEKTDQVLSVFDDGSERLPSKGSTLSLSKKKLWSSAKSLETDNVEAPTMLRTIGKLLEINQDGNHIIELTKPPHGPIGFYIGRGTANYDYGIFVSRFSDVSLEKLFAGLMNVGDEILEINQRPVRDLSLDDAYELMAARNKLVLKVFPLSSRRDL